MALLFQENWNGSSLDTGTWTQTWGTAPTVSSNVLRSGTSGYMDINTQGKASFTVTGETTIEFATTNLNASQDTAFILKDVSNTANSLLCYCNENYYNQGIRIDVGGVFANGSYINTGGDQTTKQYYKIVLNGTSFYLQQGSVYGGNDRNLTKTLGASCEGYTFFITLNTNNGSNGQSDFYPITVTNLVSGVRPQFLGFAGI